MKHLLYFFLGLIILSSCHSEKKQSSTDQSKNLLIAFYNVENLFDTIHAEGKVDEEFTPSSKKNWNTEKYFHKLSQLAKVIDSIGGQQLPDMIGLEEVENTAVLKDLVEQKSIRKAHYQIIHYESPDFRGIDNALLYNPDVFTPIYQEAIPIIMPDSIASINNHKLTSRDILYVKGLVYGRDTLHIFVNHWTSMYYGEKETIPHRIYCASVLKQHIDSIMKSNVHANIILGGDLNEDVFGPAVVGIINPDTNYNEPQANRVYNMSHYLFTQKGQGTYNYKGVWGILDHIMVSGTLLRGENGIYTSKEQAHIFNSQMVMNKYNNRYGKGVRPNRSYAGNNYYAGYSDHLPIYLQLEILP